MAEPPVDMAELQLQIDGLTRQVEEESDANLALSEELQSVYNSISADVSAYTAEKDRLKGRIQQSQTRLKVLNDSYEVEIEKWKIAKAKQEDLIKDRTNRLATLRDQLEQNEQLKALLESPESLNEQVACMEEKLKKCEKEIGVIVKVQQQYDVELDESKSKLEANPRRVEVQCRELEARRREIEDKKQEKSDLTDEQLHLRRQVAAGAASLEQAKQALDEKNKEVQKLKAAAFSFVTPTETDSPYCRMAEEQVDVGELQTRIDGLRRQLEGLSSEKKVLIDSLHQLKTAGFELRSEADEDCLLLSNQLQISETLYAAQREEKIADTHRWKNDVDKLRQESKDLTKTAEEPPPSRGGESVPQKTSSGDDG